MSGWLPHKLCQSLRLWLAALGRDLDGDARQDFAPIETNLTQTKGGFNRHLLLNLHPVGRNPDAIGPVRLSELHLPLKVIAANRVALSAAVKAGQLPAADVFEPRDNPLPRRWPDVGGAEYFNHHSPFTLKPNLSLSHCVKK